MENQKPDNAPVFPSLAHSESWKNSDGITIHETQTVGGMTLRDYFAAASLTGLIREAVDRGDAVLLDEIAGDAYRLADFMLAKRAKAGGR